MGSNGSGLVAVITVAFASFTLVGLLDVIAWPTASWARIGKSKALWVVLQLALTTLATGIYFLDIRPRLSADSARLEAVANKRLLVNGGLAVLVTTVVALVVATRR